MDHTICKTRRRLTPPARLPAAPLQRRLVSWAAMLVCLVGGLCLTGCSGSDAAVTEAEDADPVDASALGRNCMSLDEVWRPSSVPVARPTQFGAVVNDGQDDTDALVATIGALPTTGGVVLLPSGTLDKRERLWRIRKDHVHLWSPNRRSTLHSTARSLTPAERADDLCGVRQHATMFSGTTGGGVFGLRITGNATERTRCAEDSHLVLQSVNGMDIVGNDISGASATGVFVTAQSGGAASRNTFFEGNFVHRNWADSIHHTRGARRSFAWRNHFFNEAPSLGDDGIACVTYGPDSPRCGEMEWFGNFYLGGAHGRGFAVIGGEDIDIHDNWVVGSASAGLIVASELAFDSASSERVQLRSNFVVNSPNGMVNNGHTAILIDGGNPASPPLRDIVSVGNVVINAFRNRVERASNRVELASIEMANFTDAGLLPTAAPTLADVRVQDTSVLRTHDVSFAPQEQRKGLYRIHLREAAGGQLENRYEYVVSGSPQVVAAWVSEARIDGAYFTESRGAGNTAVALLLSPQPLTVPDTLSGVSFDTLRAGDRDGDLAWLWARVDKGDYTAPVCRNRRNPRR